MKPVEYVVLQITTTAPVLMQSVRCLLQYGTRSYGDIFVVDNCSVHLQGDKIGIQNELWDKYEIMMVPLPPYIPEFNLTELVFNTLLQRLSSVQARHNTMSEIYFYEAIVMTMDWFDHHNVKTFFNFCGY